jgi:hypothetical protein
MDSFVGLPTQSVCRSARVPGVCGVRLWLLWAASSASFSARLRSPSIPEKMAVKPRPKDSAGNICRALSTADRASSRRPANKTGMNMTRFGMSLGWMIKTESKVPQDAPCHGESAAIVGRIRCLKRPQASAHEYAIAEANPRPISLSPCGEIPSTIVGRARSARCFTFCTNV